MTLEVVAQQQFDAYNARDLVRFVALHSEDVRVFNPPSTVPSIEGKAAFTRHYADKRFKLPGLHAELLSLMVVGNKVIDHEHMSGVGDVPVEAAVVYEVVEGLIRTVWFYAGA